jgi:hypothetical protein
LYSFQPAETFVELIRGHYTSITVLEKNNLV